MIKIAHLLGEAGWTLRSGGAEGADAAFEHGAGLVTALGPYPNMEIYLPWKGFNGRPRVSPPYFWDAHYPEAAELLAADIHPAWDMCTHGAKMLHTRNIHQVVGLDMKTHSQAVVCWTLDGFLRGGTRTALVLARSLDIPIWNLARGDAADLSADRIAIQVLASPAA